MTALTSCGILFFVVVLLQIYHIATAITTRIQPQDLQVAVGSTVTLTCAADNIGAHSIYWYRHSRQAYLTKNSKVFHQVGQLSGFYPRLTIVGDTAHGEFNLRIANVTFQDADRYSCVYFQGSRYVTESRAGELKVYEAPAKGFPKCSMAPDTGLGPGDRVTIKCLSKRSTGAPNSRLDWHRWYEMLPGTFEQGNNPKANYATVLTEHDNGAVFTCVESSPVLDVPRTCNVTPFLIPTNVTVVALPERSASKSDKKRTGSGRELVFGCRAEAIPPVTNFTWYLSGELVEDSPKMSIENNGEHLRIRDVQLSDNGSIIECQVWNSALIKGSGETMLKVERVIRSAQTAGSPHFATSDIGTIIGPSVGLIILISIVIYLVVRLRNKKLSNRRGSDVQEPVNRNDIHPAIEPLTEPTVVVTEEVSNSESEETEPLTGVTICSTPHAAIVEHLREHGNPSDMPDGAMNRDRRTSAKTASRVLMVGRLSSVTSDSSENKDHESVDVNQLYTKPLKRGIKKSEISSPISISSETDSIYVNCPNTNSVHV